VGETREKSRIASLGSVKPTGLTALRMIGFTHPTIAHPTRAEYIGPSPAAPSRETICGLRKVKSVVQKQVPPPEAPAPKRLFGRVGQVDRGRRTPREEERLVAPRSASATPAQESNRKRPPHADQRRGKAVREPFDARMAISSVVLMSFRCPYSTQSVCNDLEADERIGATSIGGTA
jgi:hypothetical protein